MKGKGGLDKVWICLFTYLFNCKSDTSRMGHKTIFEMCMKICFTEREA